MPLGLLLFVLKYLVLAGLLAFVVLILREMMTALPRLASGDELRTEARPAVRSSLPAQALRPAEPPGEQVVREMPNPVAESSSEQPLVAAASPASPAPPTSLSSPELEPIEQGEPVASQAPTRGERASAPAQPTAALRVLDAGDSNLMVGRVMELTNGVHIGRAPSNDIVVEDSHVSRQHAYLGRRGYNWVLVDKGSVNGTAVNGRRLTGPLVVRNGDVISVGSVTFAFICHGGKRRG
ncbi:MAG: FHA domain-containing protein [Armatimonadota bacterium]|mgnify:CR=1 FL=1